MLCFRDMTFCDASDCSDWDNCHRAYTKDVHTAACEWMDNPPIMLFVSPPDCYTKYIKEEGSDGIVASR